MLKQSGRYPGEPRPDRLPQGSRSNRVGCHPTAARRISPRSTSRSIFLS